ncbi:hypothetical protein CLU79DRAFT_718081 [Phycomyces nitens]|nr:hypothetical protein CLU79DRAFT_718081 [Phycomyces nitens]
MEHYGKIINPAKLSALSIPPTVPSVFCLYHTSHHHKTSSKDKDIDILKAKNLIKVITVRESTADMFKAQKYTLIEIKIDAGEIDELVADPTGDSLNSGKCFKSSCDIRVTYNTFVTLYLSLFLVNPGNPDLNVG